MNSATWEIMLVGVVGLAGIGLYGLLTCRNFLKIIVALQILVKGSVLALVAAGAEAGRLNLGQSLAINVIAIDTVVAVIGLALGIAIRQRLGTLDVARLSDLRG